MEDDSEECVAAVAPVNTSANVDKVADIDILITRLCRKDAGGEEEQQPEQEERRGEGEQGGWEK